LTSTPLERIARRAQATALCFGVVTFLSGLGKFWPTPGWLDTNYAAVVFFAPIIFALVLIGTFLTLFWQVCRRPPPGFQLSRYRGKPAYLAPRNLLHRGSIFIAQMMIASGLLVTTNPDDFRGLDDVLTVIAVTRPKTPRTASPDPRDREGVDLTNVDDRRTNRAGSRSNF
jgi:hypothetical protein